MTFRIIQWACALLILCLKTTPSTSFLVSDRRCASTTVKDDDAKRSTSPRKESSPSRMPLSASVAKIDPLQQQQELDVFAEIANELRLKLPATNPASYYAFVLNQLCARQPERAGPRARAIFEKLPTQTSVKLNKVLACYQTSVSTVSARVERRQLAREAYDLLSSSHENCDIISNNTMLSIWAKASQYRPAQALFEGMPVKDNISYSSMIHAYATAGRAAEARTFLDTIPRPTIHCYNDVLQAYVQANQVSEAASFLKTWVMSTKANNNNNNNSSSRNGKNNNNNNNNNNKSNTLSISNNSGPSVKPTTRSYNIVLNGLPFRRAERFFEQIPHKDSVSYTTMISIGCQSRNCPLSTIQKYIEQIPDSYHLALTPATIRNVLYSLALMNGRSTSTDVVRYAQDLVFSTMPLRGIRPDIQVYNALLYCLSQQPAATGEQFLQILEDLEDQTEDTSTNSLKPNVKTYTNVLNGLKGRGDVFIPAAQDVLERMEPACRPTVATFTSMIQVYARSNVPAKALSAYQMLQRIPLEQRNIVAYNAVLNACEYTSTTSDDANDDDNDWPEQALKIACLVFDEIRTHESLQATHVTYGSFLGALANLMPTPESRQDVVRRVWKRCAAEGQASALVWKKLERASPTVYTAVLQQHAVAPPEWSRSVRDGKARKEFQSR